MLVLLKEGSIARAPNARRGAGRAALARARVAARPARRAARRAALRARALPRRVRLGRPALPAGLAAAAARRVRRAHLHGGARLGRAAAARSAPGASTSSSALTGDPRAGHRRRLARPSMPLLLGAARLRRAAGAAARPARAGRSPSAPSPGCSAGRSGSRPSTAGRSSRCRCRGRRRCCPRARSSPRSPASAGGVLGALFAAALRGQLPPPRVARLACVGAFALLDRASASTPGIKRRARRPRARRAHRRAPGAAARGARHRAARPAGRRRRRQLALHPRLGGRRRPRGRPPGASATASTARPSRSRCTARGRSGCGSTAAASAARCRCACRSTAACRTPSRRFPAVATAEQLERAMRESAGAELPAPGVVHPPVRRRQPDRAARDQGRRRRLAVGAGDRLHRAALGAVHRRARPRARPDGAARGHARRPGPRAG